MSRHDSPTLIHCHRQLLIRVIKEPVAADCNESAEARGRGVSLKMNLPRDNFFHVITKSSLREGGEEMAPACAPAKSVRRVKFRLELRHSQADGRTPRNKMIKTRRWKRGSKRETEKEKRKGRKRRDTRELSFYGSLVNYRPYNQSVPRYYPQRRKTEKERQNRRMEARERERENDTKRGIRSS